MSAATPWDSSTFTLTYSDDATYETLLQAAEPALVHFFIREAIDQSALPEISAPASAYCLRRLDHQSELRSDHFELDAGWHHATLADLLAFASAYPVAHEEADVLALGTMRWRRVSEDAPGETLWGDFALEHGMCQWVVGLGGHEGSRRVLPFEVFLGDLLRRGAYTLLRAD